MKQIKVLKRFPPHLKCPFCDTNKSAKTLLIPVMEKGHNYIRKVIAVHKRCILEHLLLDEETGIFFAPHKNTTVKHKSG